MVNGAESPSPAAHGGHAGRYGEAVSRLQRHGGVSGEEQAEREEEEDGERERLQHDLGFTD